MTPMLSDRQQRVWDLQQGRRESPYCVSAVVEVRGKVDEARLRDALRDAINEEPSAFLALMPHGSEVDDIETLVTSIVSQTSETLTQWTLQASALIVDAEALRLLVRRTMARYAGETLNNAEESPAYAVYREWQQALIAGPHSQGTEYWGRHTCPYPAASPLPGWRAVDRAVEGGAFRPLRLSRMVPVALAEELERRGMRMHVPLRHCLLAAWQILLWRHLRGHIVDVGVFATGRAHPALRGVRGPCACVLSVHLDVDPAWTFADVLTRTARIMRAHEVWQDAFSWTLLDARSDGAADGATVPPHHAFGFEWQDLREDESAAGSRAQEPVFQIVEIAATIDRCDLRASLTSTDAGLVCAFEWDPACADHSEVSLLADRYVALLNGLVKSSHLSIEELPILEADETERLLATGCGVGAAYSHTQSVPALFARQVAATPMRTAVIAGGSRLTYAEVDRRATHRARELAAAGVTPGTRVAIALPRGSDQIVSVLAVLRTGGAFVPLDPAQPAERLAWMLADAKVPVLITEERLWPQGLPEVAHAMRLDVDRPDWSESAPALPDAIDPAQASYVIYTSGTTGRPKGVVVSHRSLVHSTEARGIAYRHAVERYLLVSTLAFDSAMAGLFWTLCSGGTLVLPDDAEHADPVALRGLIAAHDVTHMLCLPSLYGWVIDEPESLQSLRVAIVAGEACPRALVSRHHRQLPQVELHNEYGPTECAVWSTVHETRADDTRDRVPIGRPIARARVYVAERPWRLSPWGVTGEGLIGGAGVSDGYLDRPDLTADRFRPDAWSSVPGARAYRTGDRVRWLADGSLDFLGRLDCQVKVRGYRIELEEVESVIAAHPDVRQCVVTLRDDQQALDAFVVIDPAINEGVEVAARVRGALAAQLPGYMIPSEIHLVADLPKTPNGKVDRPALASRPRPRETPRADGDRPVTSAEETIAALWAELLGRDVARQDNFFDIGGHSLLAIEVFHRLRQVLAPGLRLIDLFEHPTVQALAAFIGSAQPDAGAAPTSAAQAAQAAEVADAGDAAAVRVRRQALGDRRRAARVS